MLGSLYANASISSFCLALRVDTSSTDSIWKSLNLLRGKGTKHVQFVRHGCWAFSRPRWLGLGDPAASCFVRHLSFEPNRADRESAKWPQRVAPSNLPTYLSNTIELGARGGWTDIVWSILDPTFFDQRGGMGKAAQFYLLCCQAVQRGSVIWPCPAFCWPVCSDAARNPGVPSFRGKLSCKPLSIRVYLQTKSHCLAALVPYLFVGPSYALSKVILGREVGRKCATRRMDELERETCFACLFEVFSEF